MEFAKIFFTMWDKTQEATLKLIKHIPEDKLDFKPGEKGFTTRELVHHIYSAEETFISSIMEKGEIKFEDFANLKTTVQDLKTVDDLYKYAEKVHRETKKYADNLGKEDLLRVTNSFFGPLPLFALLNGFFIHFTHHRGQIYTYLRLSGVEEKLPDMM